MHSAQREALAKRALEMAGAADEAEVLVSTADAALTRFTHQVSNQNVASADAGISVRAIVDKRTGVARTNRFDDASLRDAADRAVEMARLAPQDPLQPGLPRGGPSTAPPGAYDESTADAPADLRASMCAALFSEAEAAGQWCAGFVSTSGAGYTVVNTSGALASFDGSDAAVNVKMNAPDSTGFAEAYSTRAGAIDAAAVGRRATTKASGAMHPVAVDPGAWTVILEPSAFGELFVYLSEHFSAQTYDEGASFCSDGLDRS
ncbi:MAG TPA: DNA gyrase modulator [Candidatus Baltobacteraceae bacterium]|nr:DNA gyrase modulator [Candidatus Baltobacteraceae bacterium]